MTSFYDLYELIYFTIFYPVSLVIRLPISVLFIAMCFLLYVHAVQYDLLYCDLQDGGIHAYKQSASWNSH